MKGGPCAHFLFEWLFDFMKKLETVIEEAVNETGNEFVGMEILPQHGGMLYRIYVDAANGITIGALQAVSRHVDGVLAVEFPDMVRYTLEVSSPGVDRLLFTLAHYQKYVGKMVRVKLSKSQEGRKNITGIVRKADAESIQLELDSPNGVVELAFSTIEKARLVPEL